MYSISGNSETLTPHSLITLGKSRQTGKLEELAVDLATAFRNLAIGNFVLLTSEYFACFILTATVSSSSSTLAQGHSRVSQFVPKVHRIDRCIEYHRSFQCAH
uniref:Uncharacterized protein n=1 Tax=Anopheles atroparvus TaxID=41427 RepID=A0A182IVD5_ANOAO